eukprot:284815694_4
MGSRGGASAGAEGVRWLMGRAFNAISAAHCGSPTLATRVCKPFPDPPPHGPEPGLCPGPAALPGPEVLERQPPGAPCDAA